MPRKQSRRTRDAVGQGEGQAGGGGGGAANPITACRWLHARGWAGAGPATEARTIGGGGSHCCRRTGSGARTRRRSRRAAGVGGGCLWRTPGQRREATRRDYGWRSSRVASPAAAQVQVAVAGRAEPGRKQRHEPRRKQRHEPSTGVGKPERGPVRIPYLTSGHPAGHACQSHAV